MVDKHKVNILYTAPTAIRALMAQGESCMDGTTRGSLKLLGSVGEPINRKPGSGITALSVTASARS